MKEWMKSSGLAIVVGILTAVCLGGCVAAMKAIGLDPETGEIVNPGGGIVGTIGSLFWPGAGGIAAAIATLVSDIKRKKWKSLATAGFNTLNDLRIKHSKGEKITADTVVKSAIKHQSKEKIKPALAKKEVKAVEAKSKIVA